MYVQTLDFFLSGSISILFFENFFLFYPAWKLPIDQISYLLILFFAVFFFSLVKWISEFLISDIVFHFRQLFDFYYGFQFSVEILYFLTHFIFFACIFFERPESKYFGLRRPYIVSDAAIHPWHCGTKQTQTVPKQIIMAIFQ